MFINIDLNQYERRCPVEWINAAEAAERLGVKPATLYAYVSRGVLRRRRSPDGRSSLFDPAEIDELSRRGRPRRPASPTELVIESAVTAFADGRPYYRGRDAIALAARASLEEVAGLLWDHPVPPRWPTAPEALAAGVRAQSGLPPVTLPLERLQVINAALATTDPVRLHLDPPAVVTAGQNLVAGLVDCLAGAAPAGVAPEGATLAERLWWSLCPRPPAPGLLDALRTALVLLADHELAASTLAVRVAASVRADPYAVVATGLGAVGGALHGGASLGVEAMLTEAGAPFGAARVVGERLRRGERIPGFGHFVYKNGDPRATCLMAAIGAAADGHPELAVAEAVLAEARRRRLPEPNIDFAVATLARVAGMAEGAGEAVFAIARTTGWLAHAMEEYHQNTPLRPRAVYVGPPPGG
jgi:citrate synthase